MKNTMWKWLCALGAWGLSGTPAMAHDPIFGIGPHVLYKGGVETALALDADKAGDEKQQAAVLELTYGLSGDWAAGVDLPYVVKDQGANTNRGAGDLGLFTKYRFWRADSLGLQQSAAVHLKLLTDTASDRGVPSLDKGTTDAVLGLSYGYEGRKWYRWVSARYRANGKNKAGFQRGDKILLDLVGGIRPRQTKYLEADTVWLLELNGEYARQARQGGVRLSNSGGTEWFVSPGIFWTKRNFAIKAGVQIPVFHDLNGTQAESDYRAHATFEWHL